MCPIRFASPFCSMNFVPFGALPLVTMPVLLSPEGKATTSLRCLFPQRGNQQQQSCCSPPGRNGGKRQAVVLPLRGNEGKRQAVARRAKTTTFLFASLYPRGVQQRATTTMFLFAVYCFCCFLRPLLPHPLRCPFGT